MRPRQFRFDDSALPLEARIELARWRADVSRKELFVYNDYSGEAILQAFRMGLRNPDEREMK